MLPGVCRCLVTPSALVSCPASSVVRSHQPLVCCMCPRADGRPVAIKRLLRQFYELARKEISALILSDEHPNIVRCFAMEEDAEFVYLALERCKCTLSDAMGSDAIR